MYVIVLLEREVTIMKIIQDKTIDIIYLNELEEIAEWYEEDLEFALKQCISLHHTEIKKSKEGRKLYESNQH